MPRCYWIDTSGCQMNERDSETLAGICEGLGLSPCDDPADAEVAILNTCAVREKPQEKVYSRLGELRKLGGPHGGPLIVVTGCVAQIDADELRRRGADIVVGPRCYDMLQSALEERLSGCAFIEGEDRTVAECLPAARASKLKAFVNIIYGCDNFCAYCIVPYSRGREQSRQPSDILAEVREVVADGCRDVTLLGQNVNSYGHDLPEPVSFAELMRRVDAVEGLDRLRFTTSHPKDMTRELIDTMASLPSACEHLHLPIQAGSDAVLEAMGRGYSYAHFRSLIEAAREAMPRMSVTTDVMVGFPGETEEDFEATLRAFEEIRFDQAFMFKYNDRPGTRAATMEPKVSNAEKQRRLLKLVALQNATSREINVATEGEVFEVLVEEADPKSAGKVRGRTRQNKLMIFPGEESLIGELVNVRAVKGFLWGWTGERV